MSLSSSLICSRLSPGGSDMIHSRFVRSHFLARSRWVTATSPSGLPPSPG